MTDEQDPLGLFEGVKEYDTCEDCGKKIDSTFKKCYLCYMKDKKSMEELK